MHFHPPLLAAGGAGMIIWLIIIVFWALSTMVQKSREKKEAERRRALRPAGPSGAPPPLVPPPEPQKAADPEEELRRFLQELTGMGPAQPKPEPAAPPPLPPAQPRRMTARAHPRTAPPPPPLIQFDEPPAAPARAEPAGAYANTSQEIGAANDQHIYETLDEMEDIEVLMTRQAASLYSGETMVRQDSMLVNLSKIRVPLMTLPFVSYKSVRHATNRPPLTGSRDALRQALIARVVLGPCKAFDAAPGKDGLANQ